jgi:hypothetical protein
LSGQSGTASGCLRGRFSWYRLWVFHDAKTIEKNTTSLAPRSLSRPGSDAANCDEIKEAFEKFGAEGLAPRLTDILCQRDGECISGGRDAAGRLDRRRAGDAARLLNERKVIKHLFPIDPDTVSTGHLASRD